MKQEKKLIDIFVVSTIVGLILTFIGLICTKGEIWRWVFCQDTRDTGMDFFHSIEYVIGRSPYEDWGTLYPPLANAFFWLLSLTIPKYQYSQWTSEFSDSINARGTNIDLRTYQPTMMLFIVFIVVSTLLLVAMVRTITKDDKRSLLCAVSCLMSYSMLYAFERGNIIVIALICAAFFVVFRKSENKVLSELALIMLAISAGLKLYPAALGLLLVTDKTFKKGFRTVLYGAIAFFLPFFVFKEGLGGFIVFLRQLWNHTRGRSWETAGFSMDCIIKNIICFVAENRFAIDEDAIIRSLSLVNIVSAAICILAVFFLRKEWEKVLACIMAILLFSNQYTYGLCFLIIPLLLLITSEVTFTRKNALPFICLLNSMVILPFANVEMHSYSLSCLRIQIGMLVLLGYLVYSAVSSGICIVKTRKAKFPNN